ncbi:MAG: DUF4388 domain-containing protein [bacterium]|nr:MAG: DUF4388 domain-containing protein [bacterium]
MALEGNVKDFGLSEIFQLISLQKKSGMLSVTGEKPIVVFFKNGSVISTRDRRDRSRDPLKDYLLRYGFIDSDEMKRIERIQTETNLDLTDILLSEKYFSEDELKTIFTEQIQETVQDVLSWPRSYYKFIIGTQVLRGITHYAAMQVEGLLMESMRRIDEFAELQRIFPSEKMVLKRQAMPKSKPPRLESHEEFIYDLLEQVMTLEKLISHARMPRFCTYEALKNLLEKELLQIIDEPKPIEWEESTTVSEAKKQRKRRFLPTVAAVFLLIACFAAGEYGVPYVLPPGWSARFAKAGQVEATGTGNLFSADLQELRLRQLEATVEESLEAYLAIKGSYPFTLESLAVREFIDKGTIARIHQNDIRYRIDENGTSYMLIRNRTR